MTATPPGTGMGPENPVTSTRSAKRTRRMIVVGALALVLVAGAVLVGVRTAGTRSGALSSAAVNVNTGLHCSRDYNAEYSGDTSNPDVWLIWNIPAGSPGSTVYRAYQRTGTKPAFTYSAELTSTVQSQAAHWASGGGIAFAFDTPNTSAQTFVITWGRTTSTGEDTMFSEVLCAAA